MDTWATVAVAIGTIAAVAYALFRDLVVTPRRRPKLELRFDRGGNDQVVVETEEGSEAAYARLRVANRGGRDTADDVVVMVTELRRLENSETRPIGLPLAWSGSRPPLTVASVHPGSERHVDLLHLSEAVPVQLDLTPQPTGGRGVLEAGAYEISVEVRQGTRTRSAMPSRSAGTASGPGRLRCGTTCSSTRRGWFGERRAGRLRHHV